MLSSSSKFHDHVRVLEVTESLLPSDGRLIPYSKRQPEDCLGNPIFFMGGIPPINGKHNEDFVNWLAQAGLGRQVIEAERPEGGSKSHGKKYQENLRALFELLQSTCAHVVGFSMGGAEAIQLVHSLMSEINDIEKVRQHIASLTLINSAGLTKNSRFGHMKRFLQTGFATRKLPDEERKIQTEWMQACNDLSKIVQRWREVGHIVALSRGQIAKMLLEIKTAGIPVLALQALDDTLIPPDLLHKEIRGLVKTGEMGNHLGIYADPGNYGEEIIKFLDAIDHPELVGSTKDEFIPTYATG